MTAVTDRQYAQAKLRDAEKAEQRVRTQAVQVFGAQAGAVVDRAMAVTIARMQNDNPEIVQATRRSR